MYEWRNWSTAGKRRDNYWTTGKGPAVEKVAGKYYAVNGLAAYRGQIPIGPFDTLEAAQAAAIINFGTAVPNHERE